EEILNKILQEKSELSVPLIAFALYSLRFTINENTQNTWQYIGYWRNRIQLEFSVLEEKYVLTFEKKKEDEIEFHFEESFFSVKNIEVGPNEISLNIDGINHHAHISFGEKGLAWFSIDGKLLQMKRLDMLNMKEDFASQVQGDGISNLFSPMPGKVIKVNVKAGEKVKRGKVLLVVEAMKMENNIISETSGIVEKVVVKEGDMVDTDTQLVYLEIIDKE
ncbi:MAG TPA: biotin/lipoyl-containing protein, partial [Bacteroidales bacterium]